MIRCPWALSVSSSDRPVPTRLGDPMADIPVPVAAWHAPHLHREQTYKVLPVVLKILSSPLTAHPVHLCQLLNKRVQVLLCVRPLNWSTTLFPTNPLRDELS